MADTNKKRTAVLAAATAAALVLTGTFAWVMSDDQTKLNEFNAKDPGTYDVELKEDFDPDKPWDNKDVWVENKGDNPVIVRVRLEEFYDLEYRDGTTYNIKKGLANGDADGKAIFKVPGPSMLADDLTADSSTGIDKNVILKFGENGAGVTTMEKWNAMTDEEKAAISWVIDTDGWCYYTKALLYGEKTSNLLDDVDFNEDLFLQSHSKPYNLDYKINVRLQAMSADLADFGSTTNTAQWTNLEGGREISKTENPYESIENQTISDAAKALVLGIENPDKSAGKVVTNAENLNTLLADESTDTIKLSGDVDLGSTQIIVPAGATKTLDLAEGTVTTTSATSIISVSEGGTLVVENGTINAGTARAVDVYGKVELNNVEITSTQKNGAVLVQKDGEAVVKDSTITSGGKGGVFVRENGKVTITGSTVSGNVDGVYISKENAVITIEDSEINGNTEAMLIYKNTTLNAKNTKFNGGFYGIGFNNTYLAKEVNLTDCTITGEAIGVFKSDNSPMTLTNCTVNVTATDADGACGICVRSGDVTLDNVTVNVDKGENVITSAHGDDGVAEYFATNPGCDTFGFNALQVVLNSYENINLTINGGSYKTNIDGVNSTVVCNGKPKADYTFENTITVTNNPKFSPDFTFGTYENTTVNP